MRVQQLILSNFRGQRKLSLQFQPGFNLIVGVNGAGKTTILEALRIVLARALPSFSKANRYPGITLAQQDITIGRESTHLEAKLNVRNREYYLLLSENRKKRENTIDPESGYRKMADVEELVNRRKAIRPKKGDFRLEGTIRGQTSERQDWDGEIVPNPGSAIRQIKPQPLALFMSVRRSIASEKVPRGETSVGYRGVFDVERGLELGYLMKWWDGRETLAKEDPSSKSAKQLATIKKALARMLPELSNWRMDKGMLNLTKRVDVERVGQDGAKYTETESVEMPATFLSDGERSIFSICVDIAQRLILLNDEMESPLDEGAGVVLIDEIDLHLHPTWQRRIARDLRESFPNIQFICTTHSPFLIQSINAGELIKLDGEIDSEYANKSIEDVSEGVLDVEIPQRSMRYLAMYKAAEEYFTLLRISPKSEKELVRLKQKLDDLSFPFSDDPAFQALLKQERIATLGAENR